MKNVLLIGDSIRAVYDKSIKKTLEGVANVCFPEENTRFAAYVFRYISEFKDLFDGEKIDIIHWNAGLWDCLRLLGEDPQTPIEIYKYYIDRICARMKKCYPEAKIIFATTTAIREDIMDADFARYNTEIEEYNKAAVEIVTKYGFEVNDLYSLSRSVPPEAYSDDVHYYTPLGTEIFTKQVLKYIAAALELEEVPEYKEVLYTSKPVGR